MLSCLSVSLGIVMAGSGDIDCFRIFRELRWRADEGSYGSHFAVSMAIGMLFLAGGKASFRRDNFSIGCLLLSTAPRFPSRTVDNQYHLQALRHLYALAIDRRFLRVVDVESDEMISLPVDIVKISGEIVRVVSPCLLYELADVCEIRLPKAVRAPDSWSSVCGQYIGSSLKVDSIECHNSLPVMFVKNISDITTNEFSDLTELNEIELKKLTASYFVDILNGEYSSISQSKKYFPVKGKEVIIDNLANNSLYASLQKLGASFDELTTEKSEVDSNMAFIMELFGI